MIMLSKRSYTTVILCVTVIFLFADQNLLAPNLSMIAREFGFSDSQRDDLLGGQIALGFFIIGGAVSVIAGYFADTLNRCLLFGFVVCFGEAACLATYWTKTYSQLYLCRVLTGISIGGAVPIIFSLLGDLYPGTSRVKVSTAVGISMSAGVALGQLIAGFVGPVYGWRLPFVIVSVPALLCSVLILITAYEPRRGLQEEEVILMRRASSLLYTKKIHQSDNSTCGVDHKRDSAPGRYAHKGDHMQSTLTASILPRGSDSTSGSSGSDVSHEVDYKERIDFNKLWTLFKTPSVAIIFLQGFPGCLPWGMANTFLNDYFSSDRGLSVGESTSAIVMLGVGMFFGQIFGGVCGQGLYNLRKTYQPLLMGFSTMLAVPPMIYLLNTDTPGDAIFFLVLFIGGFAVAANGPNVRSVLQNVCAPEMRGTAFAFFNLTDDLGKGVGPVFVVYLIRAFKQDRQMAFTAVTFMWIVCGALLLCLTATVERDERAVQAHVRAVLHTQYINTSAASATAPMAGRESPLQCIGIGRHDELMYVLPLPSPACYDSVAIRHDESKEYSEASSEMESLKEMDRQQSCLPSGADIATESSRHALSFSS